MILNDLVDSFCYSQKNAGLKGLTMACLSAAGVCVILYADDILLVASSGCGLDALTKTCEIELNKLDMVVNTQKSCWLRIEPRNNASCLPVSLSAGSHLMGRRDEISRNIYCTLTHI